MCTNYEILWRYKKTKKQTRDFRVLGSVATIFLLWLNDNNNENLLVFCIILFTLVGVTETATHPQRLMAGLIPVPYPNHNAIYVQRFAPQPPGGVCVPPQFESDQSQLLSTSDNNDVNGEHSMQSTTSPMVVTTGAPPPYAEVAPEEGGQSMDEPPPPYQDHERWICQS